MDRPADTAISLRSVTKTYDLWSEPSARLLGALRSLVPGVQPARPPQFTAVRDVSLEIPRGDCVGIIGRNGAGKSTLLQMIAGTLQPSAGEIRVNGRVAALLELGSGFNPDFTGRENIHLNAAILGLGRQEIATKFDAIVAYSGIEEFIDRPVRTYSSGMTVRLAFAVCVHVDADILIIDEALAVGDARFQFKCHATLDQLIAEGRTVLFVSHDTNAVKRMCRTAVLLERGEMILQGAPNDVTNLYTKLITSPHGLEAIRGDLAALKERQEKGGRGSGEGRKEKGTGSKEDGAKEKPPLPSPASLVPSSLAPAAERLLSEERAHQQISDKEYAYGGETGRIQTVRVTDAEQQPRLAFPTGSLLCVHLTCEATRPVEDPIYALTIKDVRGQEIFGTNTYFQNQACPAVPAGGRTEVRFEVRLNVQPGVYFLSLGWVRLHHKGEVEVIHRRYDVVRFDVLPCDRSFGLAHCPTTISVSPS